MTHIEQFPQNNSSVDFICPVGHFYPLVIWVEEVFSLCVSDSSSIHLSVSFCISDLATWHIVLPTKSNTFYSDSKYCSPSVLLV